LQVENIGARRLHTVLERLIEDISFEAPDKVAAAESDPLNPKHHKQQPEASNGGSEDAASGSGHQGVAEGQQQPLSDKLQGLAEMDVFYYEHVIDKQQVREKLQSLLKQHDLSKYII
jgi:ATP-dependent HslUV protease ATP-binding subunit HslU